MNLVDGGKGEGKYPYCGGNILPRGYAEGTVASSHPTETVVFFLTSFDEIVSCLVLFEDNKIYNPSLLTKTYLTMIITKVQLH